MKNDSHPRSHARFAWRLWIGLLGSPALWLIQFQTNYSLVPWICAHGKYFLVPLVTCAFLLLSLLVGLVALTNARQPVGSSVEAVDTGLFSVSRFMSQVGVMTSGLFSVLIALQGIPFLFLSPCAE